MAKTLCYQSRGLGSIPGQGTRAHVWRLEIPHAALRPGAVKQRSQWLPVPGRALSPAES